MSVCAHGLAGAPAFRSCGCVARGGIEGPGLPISTPTSEREVPGSPHPHQHAVFRCVERGHAGCGSGPRFPKGSHVCSPPPCWLATWLSSWRNSLLVLCLASDWTVGLLLSCSRSFRPSLQYLLTPPPVPQTLVGSDSGQPQGPDAARPGPHPHGGKRGSGTTAERQR